MMSAHAAAWLMAPTCNATLMRVWRCRRRQIMASTFCCHALTCSTLCPFLMTWHGMHACRSLLCYHRYTNTLRHYDSCHSSNQRACRKVASCLSPLVQQPGRREPNYVEVTHAPQQSNPDDCGPHTLAVAQQLLAWAAAGRLYELEVLERELRRRLDSQHVQQLRTTMCNVINQLRGKVLEGVRPAGAQVV